MVADIRRCSEQRADYPRVLVIHLSSVEEGRKFFSSRWPDARSVADPDHTLYDAFGRQRAGWRELASPRVFGAAIRALFKGNFVGTAIGDPFVMPGLFLVRDQRVRWEHPFRDAGDHPDLCALGEETIAAN